jgi:hypothetical protein
MSGQVYTADDLDAWREWYDALDDPGPYHAPEYVAELAGDFEYDTEYAEAFVYGDEDAFVYYPYIRRPLADLPFAADAVEDPAEYSDVVSSWYYGGPLLSPGTDADTASEFVDAFGEHCRDRGIVAEFLRFDPNVENHADFPALDPVHNRQTVPVDLTQSTDDIWEGYEDRNRRAIKQAQDSALTIDREPTGSDLEAFHDIYTNAMEARDADEHYRFSLDFFERLLDTDFFSLVVARHAADEEPDVVGGFLIAHDDTYSHHYLSASNPDYWDLRVNNLMYHEVVLYMHDTGRDVFDFQGGRPGVFKFKKGFSPARRDFYIGKRVHDQSVYDDLVAAADDAGVDTESGYFPAYRYEQSN